MTDELFQLDLILRASSDILNIARGELQSQLKPDGSIVTNADRATEVFLRQELSSLLPGSAIWGEEFGFEAPNEIGQWQIDPIDGTTNFAYGSPIWGISVSLYRHRRMDLGAVFLPDLGEMYLAQFGYGAFLDGQRLPDVLPGPIRPEDPISVCDHVMERFGRKWITGKVRCAGASVIDGCFAATGRYRAHIGYGERLYDVGASLVICGEVGLQIEYADGTPFDLSPLVQGESIRKPWLAAPRESGLPGLIPEPRL